EPMRTGVYACKVGFAAFLLPFYFVNHPGLLMQGDTAQIILDIVAAIMLVSTVAWALFGRGLNTSLGRTSRLGLAALAVAITVPAGLIHYSAMAAFAVIALLLFTKQQRTAQKDQLRGEAT